MGAIYTGLPSINHSISESIKKILYNKNLDKRDKKLFLKLWRNYYGKTYYKLFDHTYKNLKKEIK